MTFTAALYASPASATWLALPLRASPLGGEGVLGTAVTDISAVAIASGLLLGLLTLLAGLRWGGRRPVRATAPVRALDRRRREGRARR
jgi:hypothetical protein